MMMMMMVMKTTMETNTNMMTTMMTVGRPLVGVFAGFRVDPVAAGLAAAADAVVAKLMLDCPG